MSVPGSLGYAAFTPMWANAMLECWKRREAALAMRWGMAQFEDTEAERPEFKGRRIVSYVDGRDMTFFSSGQRRAKQCVSRVVINAMLAFVMGLIAGTMALRLFLAATYAWGEVRAGEEDRSSHTDLVSEQPRGTAMRVLARRTAR